jgi:hypothetical protein
MTLTIECECGNKITLTAPPKKYLQLRDNLETKQFSYDGAEIKNGKVEEFRICCDKCKNWISFGVD